jgi:hypothetical protein
LVYSDLRDADKAHHFETLEDDEGDASLTEVSK